MPLQQATHVTRSKMIPPALRKFTRLAICARLGGRRIGRWSRSRDRLIDMMVAAMLILLCALVLGCANTESKPTSAVALSCGSNLRFDESALDDAASDPAGDAPGVALATFLMSPEAAVSRLPHANWIRVATSADGILFVAKSSIPDSPFASVELRREGQSAWAPTAWGGCLPRYESDTVEAADWDLVAAPNGDATSFGAFVHAVNCATFGVGDDVILTPTIAYGPQVVTVTIWVARTPAPLGPVGCPARPPQLYEVSLTEVLGTRQLLQGGVIPQQPVRVGTPVVDPGQSSPGPDLRSPVSSPTAVVGRDF
jgi:hypothetical protein